MLEQAAISGRSRPGSYSQTLSSGSFFIVLLLEGTPSEVTMEFGRNVLSKIEEIITQSPQTLPAELVEMQVEEYSPTTSVSIGVFRIDGQTLSGAVFGKIGAKIIRQNKIINLVPQKEAAASEKNGQVSVSGTLQQRDLLIVGTDEVMELVRQEPTILSISSPTDLREAILPRIESLESDTGAAALLVQIDLKAEPSGETQLPREETISGSGILGRNDGLFPKFLRRQRPSLQDLHRPLYLALLALMILVSVIAWQLRSRGVEGRINGVKAMEKEANDAVASAQKLSGLNNQIAREILLQTENDIASKAAGSLGSNWKSDNSMEAKRAREILANLDKQIETVSRVYHLKSVDVFYDFSLLKSGAQISSATLHGGTMVALDGANAAAYSLVTKTKTAAILAGGDNLKGAKYLDFSGKNYFFFADSGIWQKKGDDPQSGLAQIEKPSDKWGKILNLSAFAGNLYLLDQTNIQIWKYQGTDLGFADISNYLGKGLSLDFSNVVEMAIDGYVYVLSSAGNIVKFAGGAPIEFHFSGLVTPFKKTPSFFVSDDTANIYVYDEENNMVVVTDKKGGYLSEYDLPEKALAGPVLVLADESIGKVFLISGSKVYSFDLR